ncbi:hypothetical protein DYH09_01970 [bacterium CPR1]|nr:hypothetical protein [bacterium CPR1]
MILRLILALSLLSLPALGDERPRVQLFYIEPELEMRLSVALQRGGLPLPLVRVGVARVQDRAYAQLHFQALNAPREVVQRQAATLCRRAFAHDPELVQVDLVGVDRLELKKPFGRPGVLFSAAVRRDRFLALPLTWSPGQLVNSVGAVYYSPDCTVGIGPRERLENAIHLAWQRSRPRLAPGRKAPSSPRKTAPR